MSLYRFGTPRLRISAREWCESRSAAVNLGEFCGIYAEYIGIYRQSNIGTDRLHGILEQRIRLGDEAREAYRDKYGDSQTPPPVHVLGEYVSSEAEEYERFNEAYLKQQIAQGKRARAITRISPTAIVQRLFESFAGTGFERHLQFIENAQRYARQYREFVVDTDRADSESLHVVGIREGMSQKAVSPEAIPKFKDTLSLNRDFNTATTDLLLLVLFLAVLASGAYLAFVRLEI